MEGLTGFLEALQTVYPRTQVPWCIVHRVRNTLRYVADKDRRAVVADLKRIDQATTGVEAERALETLAEHGDGQYPSLSPLWGGADGPFYNAPLV